MHGIIFKDGVETIPHKYSFLYFQPELQPSSSAGESKPWEYVMADEISGITKLSPTFISLGFAHAQQK